MPRQKFALIDLGRRIAGYVKDDCVELEPHLMLCSLEDTILFILMALCYAELSKKDQYQRSAKYFLVVTWFVLIFDNHNSIPFIIYRIPICSLW